jgi:hypothetical protein
MTRKRCILALHCRQACSRRTHPNGPTATKLLKGLLISLFFLLAHTGDARSNGGNQLVTGSGPEKPAVHGQGTVPSQGLAAPSAKRVGPPVVPPVTIGKNRFKAIHWGKEKGFGQNGGYIAAYDLRTGKELWKLRVYDIVYDPKMESDVQDVFIEKMGRTAKGLLEITDENGRQYRVDPRTRTVLEPAR